jgi:hypothetical protein
MQRNKTLIGLGATLVVLLAATAWVVLGSAEDAPKPPPELLHCTVCSVETRYRATLEGTICPQCHAGKLMPVERSANEQGGESASGFRSPLALTLMVMTVLLLLANGVVWSRHLWPDWRRTEYLYTRCNRCKRRLRYIARPFSRTILCPTCRVELVLPAAIPEGAPVPRGTARW